MSDAAITQSHMRLLQPCCAAPHASCTCVLTECKRALTQAGDFAAAWEAAIVNRVDLNCLVDFAWPSFLSGAESCRRMLCHAHGSFDRSAGAVMQKASWTPQTVVCTCMTAEGLHST